MLKNEDVYDFIHKDPNAILTQDEYEHFDECMRLKNESRPTDQVDFARAVCSVIFKRSPIWRKI